MLVFIISGDHRRYAGRHLRLGYHLVCRRHSITEGRALGDDSGDGDEPLTVFTFNGRRHQCLHNLSEILHADLLPGGVGDKDILHVFHALAELRSITDTDLVLVSVLAVV